VLQADGFSCTTAATGREALAKLGEAEFDALISDIHMEGNSRLEMVGEARVERPGLPVVLLTGQPSVATAAQSVRIPITAYLTKPPNMDELFAILDVAIADYRGLRTLQASRSRLREWEKEIARVEADLRSAPAGATAGPMGSYLRLTLHQVIMMLSDLERATVPLEQRCGAVRVEYQAALRQTVDVLERTRRNFKSKDLADLRKQIQALLDRDA
jgi:ActR/RegA family two-component response regulator